MDVHTEYTAAKWAKILKVSLSGYYAWRKRREAREKAEQAYKERIKKIFEDSRGTYGVDRICGLLRKAGYTASYDRVKRYMKEMGLVSIHRRRRQRSLTDSRKARGDGYPNLVWDIEITKPFQVISSDISYIRTDEGFGYICQIQDVASNVVLAESVADHMRSDLVVNTIKQAVKRWSLAEGTIFHSDRGSQSFSRVGKPGDNAWSESFFSNLKKERVH